MQRIWLQLVFEFYFTKWSLEYDITCPHQSHRTFRGSVLCGVNSSYQYTCLYDTNELKFTEFCQEPDNASQGQKFVFSGNRRNRPCTEKFQPFPLWSNESSQCLYEKSNCNDEGQLIYNDGTKIDDRTCQCDFSNGFDFVTIPKERCYCNPSKEDCSCFKCNRGLTGVHTGRPVCRIGGRSFDQNSFCFIETDYRKDEIEDMKKAYVHAYDHPNIEIQERNTKPIVTVVFLTVVYAILMAVLMVILQEYDEGRADILVVGIDIGSTYTGYSSSTNISFLKDPLNACDNPHWYNATQGYFTPKAPTRALFRRIGSDDIELFAFGYDAQNQYGEILTAKEYDNFLFFKDFKMCLYQDENISDEMTIKDERGREALAATVFSKVFVYLMKKVTKKYHTIPTNEIRWVITVPAVWSDKAKYFFRSCAEKAGMLKDRISILRESEAASVYFKYFSRQLLSEGIDVCIADANYIVVDIGGANVDITAHGITQSENITELCTPRSIPFGGSSVDKSFDNMFRNIVGNNVMKAIIDNNPEIYMTVMWEFEKYKANIFDPNIKVNYIYFPIEELNHLCTRYSGRNFKELLEESNYSRVLTVNDRQLYIKSSFFIFDFMSVVDKTIETIHKILLELATIKVDTILLTGGFSKSPAVNKQFKKSFPNFNVYIPSNPEDANLAVVKGATLFGHRPDIITSRITQYTFGLAINTLYEQENHKPEKHVRIDGRDLCLDIFDELIPKYRSVKVGEYIERKQVLRKGETSMKFTVYTTTQDNVVYVDDEGCYKFCELEVTIHKPSTKDLTITLIFEFGQTEFIMKAKYAESKKFIETRRDLI